MFAATFGALTLVGCVNPEGDLDDFVDRYKNAHATAGTGGTGGEGGAGGSTGCVLPEPDELSGDSLMAIAQPALGKNKVIVNLVKISAEKDGDGLKVTFDAVALAACDQKTPVGEHLPPGSYTVASDGKYDAALGEQTIPGEANSILINTPVTSSPVLHGQICSVRTAENPDATIDFSCGTLTGDLIAPIQQPLDGTFTITRVTDPDNYPELTTNCAKEAAAPPLGGCK